MKTKILPGKRFELVAEGDDDQALLDALDMERVVFVERIHRRPGAGGHTNFAVELIVDRQCKEALVANSGRAALKTIREFFRLGSAA